MAETQLEERMRGQEIKMASHESECSQRYLAISVSIGQLTKKQDQVLNVLCGLVLALLTIAGVSSPPMVRLANALFGG